MNLFYKGRGKRTVSFVGLAARWALNDVAARGGKR